MYKKAFHDCCRCWLARSTKSAEFRILSFATYHGVSGKSARMAVPLSGSDVHIALLMTIYYPFSIISWHGWNEGIDNWRRSIWPDRCKDLLGRGTPSYLLWTFRRHRSVYNCYNTCRKCKIKLCLSTQCSGGLKSGIVGVFAWIRSHADKKFQTPSREQIKYARSFGHIRVVLTQCLVCLRTEKLCGLF